MTYDDQFYDVIRAGTRSSAAVVVPIVHELLHPKRVIDVGCGEGWWASEFAELGAAVVGIDGAYVEHPAIPTAFHPVDLTEPIPIGELGSFDLAVSLEVAEHLPATRARSFVEDLTELAPAVLFSAAIPGQGGTGHVNEQWPGYWTALFEERGFRVTGALRFRIWNDDRVENWYRQNLLLAIDPGKISVAESELLELYAGPWTEPFPLVHPVLYEARRVP